MDSQSRLENFKNKGRDQESMRRRRQEVNGELRKQKKDEGLAKRRIIHEDCYSDDDPISPEKCINVSSSSASHHSSSKRSKKTMHYAANAEPQFIDDTEKAIPKDVFLECQEQMRPAKKYLMRLCLDDFKDESEEEKTKRVSQYVLKIGIKISEILKSYNDLEKVKEWRSYLWIFVSNFTDQNAKQLYQIYRQAMSDHRPPEVKKRDKTERKSRHEPSMSVPDIAQGLQNSDLHVRYAAARSACKILSSEECPPIDELIEAGVVPSLVACLTCNDNVPLQFEACCTLTNIASGTSTQTRTVVQAGAVPIFIDLLSSKHAKVAGQAVCALGNIAGDCSELRDLVIDQGVIPPLLSLLTPDISTPFRRNIAWTLSNLCRNKNPDPPIQVVRECLPALAQLICDRDLETVADACWAISYLTDGTNENIQRVIDAGVVPRLVELLQEKEDTCIKPAIRSIGNIVTGEELQIQAVIDAGALIPLKKLTCHENSSIVKAASKVGAMENICFYIEQYYALDKIKDLQKHEDSDVSRSAVAIIDSYFSGKGQKD